MTIRIGEDGTIISSEGEILQGQNPMIGDDGSIRLGSLSSAVDCSSVNPARTPPPSPLENNGTAQEEEPVPLSRGSSSFTRSASTIEYELQVKKAELRKCVRPAPIVVCVLFVVIAIAMGNAIPAVVSLAAAVPIVKDVMKRSEVSAEIDRLNAEFALVNGRSA